MLELGSFRILDNEVALDEVLEARRQDIDNLRIQVLRTGNAILAAQLTANGSGWPAPGGTGSDPRSREGEGDWRVRRRVRQQQALLTWHRRADAEWQRCCVLRYVDYLKRLGKTGEASGSLHPMDRVAWDRFAYNSYTYSPDRQGYRAYLRDVLLSEDYAFLTSPIPMLVPMENHRYHSYAVGMPGSGKSEILKALVYQLMRIGQSSIVVIDPGGDMSEQIASWPEHITSGRLIYLDPELSPSHAFTINPFDARGLSDRAKVVMAQEIVSAFESVLAADAVLTTSMRAILGPSVRLLLDRPGSTLRDLEALMMDDGELVDAGKCSRIPEVARFFQRDFEGRAGLVVTKQAIANRLSSLLNTGVLERLTCGNGGRSTVDLGWALNNKKIVVCRLSKGSLGENEASAFGKLLVALIQGHALRRGEIPEQHRPLTHLIIDEAQNFVTNSMITIIEETRKFGLTMTLGQLSVGGGMSPSLERAVVGLTRAKIVARSEPGESRHSAAMVKADANEVESMTTGNFLYRANNRPTVRFQGSSKRLGFKGAMPRSMRAQLWAFQLRAYYASLIPTVGRETGVRSVTPATMKPRKRQMAGL